MEHRAIFQSERVIAGIRAIHQTQPDQFIFDFHIRIDGPVDQQGIAIGTVRIVRPCVIELIVRIEGPVLDNQREVIHPIVLRQIQLIRIVVLDKDQSGQTGIDLFSRRS
ncbi:hypothetical protein SDC9_78851 [bioreactor metagenome]|uniref:Uncharacterized protein n=1 Tax=bioreactor metagenome TaxID=1076179 RepID=A0A644YVC4_9ZZZZ